MKKHHTYAISLVLMILILIGITFYHHYTPEPIASTTNSISNTPKIYSPPVPQQVITASEEDYARFEEMMPQTDLVQDIPKDGKIQMSFFNFNSGSREWERDYILTTGNIVQGTAEDIDVKLILHSRNLPKLNANNLCQVFQTAKTKGDFGSDLLLSKLKFSWKYKSMMGYKSCLGF